MQPREGPRLPTTLGCTEQVSTASASLWTSGSRRADIAIVSRLTDEDFSSVRRVNTRPNLLISLAELKALWHSRSSQTPDGGLSRRVHGASLDAAARHVSRSGPWPSI